MLTLQDYDNKTYELEELKQQKKVSGSRRAGAREEGGGRVGGLALILFSQTGLFAEA